MRVVKIVSEAVHMYWHDSLTHRACGVNRREVQPQQPLAVGIECLLKWFRRIEIPLKEVVLKQPNCQQGSGQ